MKWKRIRCVLCWVSRMNRVAGTQMKASAMTKSKCFPNKTNLSWHNNVPLKLLSHFDDDLGLVDYDRAFVWWQFVLFAPMFVEIVKKAKWTRGENVCRAELVALKELTDYSIRRTEVAGKVEDNFHLSVIDDPCHLDVSRTDFHFVFFNKENSQNVCPLACRGSPRLAIANNVDFNDLLFSLLLPPRFPCRQSNSHFWFFSSLFCSLFTNMFDGMCKT